MKVVRRKKKLRRRVEPAELLFYTGEAKYDVVLECARDHGWTLIPRKEALKDECNLYWVDIAVVPDRLAKLKPWQCCNHFPGTGQIANKARMAKQLDKMARKFPKDYSFYPKTWVLPSELESFRTQFDGKGETKQWFIVKPDGGCQGKGIFLTQNFNQVAQADIGVSVAQTYIRKPLLIDGLKFDLRLYVLLGSVKPLELYVFKDGLVRLCTEPYTKPSRENQDDVCMHLTNYSLNKHSDAFQESDQADGGDEASKRSVLWFMQWLEEEYDVKKANLLWSRMLAVCLKTVLSVLPTLQTEYDQLLGTTTSTESWQLPSRCFEILGVDLMIDSYLKPWLVEVNHLPSFGTDSPFDRNLKHKLLHQAMTVCKAAPSDRAEYEAEMLRRKTNAPEARRQRAIEQIKVLLEQVAPHRLARLDALLLRHDGEEEKLLAALQNKHQKLQSSDTSTQSPPGSPAPPKEFSPMSAKPSTPPRGCQPESPEPEEAPVPAPGEAASLEDYVQIWPLPEDDEPTPLPAKGSVYRKYEEFALQHEAKRLKRFVSPLQKYAGGELPPVQPATAPSTNTTTSATTFGRAGSSKSTKKPPNWKPPPMPSKNQSEAASRLARGRSSLPGYDKPKSSVSEPGGSKTQHMSHLEKAKLKSRYVLDKKVFAPITTHSFELCEQLEQMGLWQPPTQFQVVQPQRPQTNDSNRRFSF